MAAAARVVGAAGGGGGPAGGGCGTGGPPMGVVVSSASARIAGVGSGVLLIRTAILPLDSLEVTTSGRPSPLKSPTARVRVLLPPDGKVTGGRKLPSPAFWCTVK